MLRLTSRGWRTGTRSIRSTCIRCEPFAPHKHRRLVTLAIETSCDDTAVAILEKPDTDARAILWFNEKITSDNAEYGGIHPIRALESHQRNLATLVKTALEKFKEVQIAQGRSNDAVKSPELVAVTRGPGMRSNLATGIDFAKGLAVAWNVPFVGVHHMQAHLLTPRLISALDSGISATSPKQPDFPFQSLLISGGHTMLLKSSSLTEHELLAESDLPLGQALDKIARLVVPQALLDAADSTMYGATLERFAFSSMPGHEYQPPEDPTKGYYKRSYMTDHSWPWIIRAPLADADGGAKRASMEYSFTGVVSAVERIMKHDQSPGSPARAPRTGDVSVEERAALAREAMRVCFEHLASRILMALDTSNEPIKTVVVSGGVASNRYLRTIINSWLSNFGYPDVELNCPPPKYCTDNAAMIAWAAVEMYEAGWRSDLGITARRKWGLGQHSNGTEADMKGQGEENAAGILDVDGWYNVQMEVKRLHEDPKPPGG